MWEPQLGLSERGWRVIAPHMRGVDGPDADPPAMNDPPGSGGPRLNPPGDRGPRMIDDYAGDVIDLLDALHIEDAVIGGLSMGGYLAFALFRHAPTYFRGLVLADTRSPADTPEGLDGRRRMLELVGTKGPAAVADEMIPKLLGATTRATQPDIVAHVRSIILSNSSESIAGAVRAMMSRQDSTPLLPSIRVPTLILVGEEDTLTPPSAAEQMHALIAGSELVRIPAAGHLPNLEQPAAFNDALARFLDHRV
jgi:3-oxoadipate enol-lactonase